MPGFRSVAEPHWSTRRHMFFTDCKFNCLSGNFETVILYPQPSLHRVWILILSLANILPIINWAKIQTLNFIHKINKIYLQNKMT